MQVDLHGCSRALIHSILHSVRKCYTKAEKVSSQGLPYFCLHITWKVSTKKASLWSGTLKLFSSAQTDEEEMRAVVRSHCSRPIAEKTRGGLHRKRGPFCLAKLMEEGEGAGKGDLSPVFFSYHARFVSTAPRCSGEWSTNFCGDRLYV